MSIETMKQWLEALEYPLNQTHENFNVDMAELLSHRAIESLRQAIEQAQQAEPVAWRGYNWGHSPDDWVYRDFDDPILDGNGNNVGQPLYTSPPPRQPLTDEMTKQMKDRCDSYEMRGAFVDGWISAEQAHGIKEKNT